MTPTQDVRASDAERDRVLDELQRHTAAGRLTMDEFSERAAAVYRARTLTELSAISADLPAPPDSPAAPRFDRATHVALTVLAVMAALFVLAIMAHLGPLLGGAGCRW